MPPTPPPVCHHITSPHPCPPSAFSDSFTLKGTMDELRSRLFKEARSLFNSLITWHCPSFMTLQILSPRLTSQRHICPLVQGNPHHERITCNQWPLIGVRSYLRVTCLAHTRHCVLSSITQQDTSHCMLCLDFTTYSAKMSVYGTSRSKCFVLEPTKKTRTHCTQKVFHRAIALAIRSYIVACSNIFGNNSTDVFP